jgi:Holliday junction resolvasome, endonuclease subunit
MTLKDLLMILGIDPGTHITGYAVLNKGHSSPQLIDCGVIRPPAKSCLSERMATLDVALRHLMSRFRPEVVCIETQYIRINPKATLNLTMVRALVMAAAKDFSPTIKIYACTPTQAKKALVGNGHATKEQLQKMAAALFSIGLPPEDAADAIAIALFAYHLSPQLAQKLEV